MNKLLRSPQLVIIAVAFGFVVASAILCNASASVRTMDRSEMGAILAGQCKALEMNDCDGHPQNCNGDANAPCKQQNGDQVCNNSGQWLFLDDSDIDNWYSCVDYQIGNDSCQKKEPIACFKEGKCANICKFFNKGLPNVRCVNTGTTRKAAIHNEQHVDGTSPECPHHQ